MRVLPALHARALRWQAERGTVTVNRSLEWLLEQGGLYPGEANPSARYLALVCLLDRPGDDPDVMEARARIPGWGPARAIVEAQWPEGYWVSPGIGYSPRYKATIWQVVFLAALGAPRTPAIDRACAYVLDHSRLPDGRFSARKTARGATACLNGSLLRAMLQLGFEEPRLAESLDAVARTVVHDKFRCRFPDQCATGGAGLPRTGDASRSRTAQVQDRLPCLSGAVKVLGAAAQVPEEQRSSVVQAAVAEGVSLLMNDLAAADYQAAIGPGPLWQQFGFPLGEKSDLLEALGVLARLGVRRDALLGPAVEVVSSKQNGSGQWLLESTLENTWGDFGAIGQPSKWVTIRALEVLKHWGV
jgi:hypothetical protein